MFGCLPFKSLFNVHYEQDLGNRDYTNATLPKRSVMSTATTTGQTAKVNPLSDCSIEREVINSLAEFWAMRESWRQFNVDPLSSFAWNHSWWNAFESHGILHLLKFQRAGDVVGLAPFYVDQWYGLSRFRFLASGDTCTDYVDLISKPQHYDSCADSLAEYVRSKAFDVVELDCPRDDHLAILLQQQLAQDYNIDLREAEPAWKLTLPESWDDFKSTAKRSLKRKIKKAIRRLETDEFTVTTCADIPVEEAFETLKELHTLRLNSMGEPGVFADPEFESFLRSAVIDFHRQGKSEIVIVSQNGKPIASHLYFHSSDGCQLYQSGYDPEAMKLEPGHLMITLMVKKAIKRGDQCFDFLRGNESYKAYWGATPHAQNKLRLVAKRVLPTVISKVVETGRSLLHKNV